MKIALITPGFSANEQDWCIPILLNLVHGLALAHDVHVFTLRYPHQAGCYAVAGATVHALGGATVGGLKRIPLLQKALRKLSQHGPFDIVHGFWADEAGFVATRYMQRSRAKAIVSLMGGELVALSDIAYGGWRSFFGRNLTRYALEHANLVTAGSCFLANIASPFVTSAPLVEFSPGVDTALFAPQPRPQNDKLRLLHVGSLVAVKDQATLLRAFAQVHEALPKSELVLVGEGVLRTELEELSAELQISHAVQFHGNVTHDELPALYAASDLLVMSSRYESQCMVLLEALACGCPAVGTAVGLFPQMLPSDQVVAPGDINGLAQAITETCRKLPLPVVEPVQLSDSINQLLTLYDILVNNQSSTIDPAAYRIAVAS